MLMRVGASVKYVIKDTGDVAIVSVVGIDSRFAAETKPLGYSSNLFRTKRPLSVNEAHLPIPAAHLKRQLGCHANGMTQLRFPGSIFTCSE